MMEQVPPNKQHNFAENQKLHLKDKFTPKIFFRKTELSTPDGYLIEKFNYQPLK